ncbi:MAG: C40 family peptidase [Roseburia sp.]|nr:C40 family peptidase [Roseburia sp.]
MRKGTILKVFLGAGIVLSVGVLGNYITSSTTTMCRETELAGMSYTLQQYVDAQSAGAASDPEAIVAFPDDPSTGGDAAADPNAAPVSDGAVNADASADAPAPTEAPEATPKPKSEYDKTGISIAADYVNVRKKPNTDSKVVGKLYRGSAAKIKDKVGDWVKIRSGHVEGYIKSDYLAIGFSAEKLVDKFGTKIATVNTETLKVREAKNTDCAVLTLVSGEESFEVLREDKEWVKIMVDGDTKGFVSKEYVKITVKFKKAVSIEEEREEARKKAAAEAAAAQAALPQQPAQSSSSSQSSSNSGSSSSHKSSSSSHKSSSSKSGSSGKSSSSNKSSGNGGSSEESSSNSGDVVGSGDGSSIASYALQFVGNPYVYGGSSLTNGTDCSGFSQAVFRKFGISLPRTSGEQAGVGKKISVSSARAGDLIFYARNGHINHVAICIGGGRVVHASNPSTGITTSNIGYRTPYCARRIVG